MRLFTVSTFCLALRETGLPGLRLTVSAALAGVCRCGHCSIAVWVLIRGALHLLAKRRHVGESAAWLQGPSSLSCLPWTADVLALDLGSALLPLLQQLCGVSWCAMEQAHLPAFLASLLLGVSSCFILKAGCGSRAWICSVGIHAVGGSCGATCCPSSVFGGCPARGCASCSTCQAHSLVYTPLACLPGYRCIFVRILLIPTQGA